MSAGTKPSDGNRMDHFDQWEARFETALEAPARRIAWRKLIKRGCDPRFLRLALYYAASCSEGAREFESLKAFMQVRKRALNLVAELRKTILTLMAYTLWGRPVTSDLLRLWAVEEDSTLFEGFPQLLERFESILNVFKMQVPRNRHIRASEIARGEAILHIYVEETTGKLFSEETAVLLEAGAESYGVQRAPNYSAEAVNRRYRRWFRCRENSDYKELRMGNRRFLTALNYFQTGGVIARN